MSSVKREGEAPAEPLSQRKTSVFNAQKQLKILMLDSQAFRSHLMNATRNCVADLAKVHGNYGLYGFVLYTVDALAGVNPSASYETGFESRRRNLLADQDQCEWLRQHKIDIDQSILGDYRWSAYEWEHECFAVDYFDAANKLLLNATAETDDEFEELTITVLSDMVLALRNLDAEGTFSAFGDRKSLTIFCSIPNSGNTVWLERESARFLNPKPTYARFVSERIAYIEEDYPFNRDPYLAREFKELIQR